MRRQVLVTGAASGLGRAMAAALHDHGFGVWGSVRGAAEAEELRQRHHGAVRPIDLELRDPQSIARAADRLASEGPLYGLVSNAGDALAAPLEFSDPEAISELLITNVVGPLRLAQLLLPALRHGRRMHGDARVVFTGSLISAVPLPMFGPYGLTKHALVGLTDSLRAELAGERIRVCLLEPGVFSTPIWLRAHRQAIGLRRETAVTERYGELIDAAAAVTLLAHRYGADPAQAAKAVVSCLTARRPPPRRLVPGHAWAVSAAMSVLPARVSAGAAGLIRTRRGAAALRAVSDTLLRVRPARRETASQDETAVHDRSTMPHA